MSRVSLIAVRLLHSPHEILFITTWLNRENYAPRTFRSLRTTPPWQQRGVCRAEQRRMPLQRPASTPRPSRSARRARAAGRVLRRVRRRAFPAQAPMMSTRLIRTFWWLSQAGQSRLDRWSWRQGWQLTVRPRRPAMVPRCRRVCARMVRNLGAMGARPRRVSHPSHLLRWMRPRGARLESIRWVRYPKPIVRPCWRSC